MLIMTFHVVVVNPLSRGIMRRTSPYDHLLWPSLGVEEDVSVSVWGGGYLGNKKMGEGI